MAPLIAAADHFQPTARGGTNELANLIYSCHACNEYKGDYWQPQSAVQRILHPLNDDMASHVAVNSEFLLVPLTPTGDSHIEKLRLNRPELVERRRKRRREENALAKIDALEARIAELETIIFLFGGILDDAIP